MKGLGGTKTQLAKYIVFQYNNLTRVVKSLTSSRRFGKAKSLTSSVREEYRVAGKFNSTEGIGETKSTKSKGGCQLDFASTARRSSS